MSLNEVASGERIHIAFLGMRNAGKSSVVNALTGLDLSVVSDVKGTTTDPVKRAMELLPLGPVVIIDTPGLDDEGELGQKRVEKARQILAKTDIAVLVVDSALGLSELDKELLKELDKRKIPHLIALNKCDLLNTPFFKGGCPQSGQGDFNVGIETFQKISLSAKADIPLYERGYLENPSSNSDNNSKNQSTLKENICDDYIIRVSAKTGQGINELKEKLGSFAKSLKNEKHFVSDLVSQKDCIILVTPIDESAPKGRLIMPQQMAIRDLLDAHCSVICCQVQELENTLNMLKNPPKLVITDSQAFKEVSAIVPDSINLTSFSILMARYKGELDSLIKGAEALSSIKDGDKVLISEGCVHHRQCNDIGTKKMPAWIEKYSKAKPEYIFSSGSDFPNDLSEFRVIVHCGGCMLNEAEMKNRISKAKDAGVPIVNYGMAIAQMHGILNRALKPIVRN
ncbi:MAG: [FeFe] hydrogenase H-cluster maturation GTPase HydF [Candidatus Riflebacteria bacterium]|nr:[FeFe] hydrogenase H-cluster maturation GTPase HydF [Candidatus Riflebacteria bacterium]